MSSSKDEIGPWSIEKLQMLERYLVAYTNILSTPKAKQNFCASFHYIDAFAGGVTHIEKETQELVDGSPRIALKMKIPFHSYTFIEKNPKRVKECLAPLKKEFPDRNITILQGECNKKIIEEILPQFPKRQGGKSKLGFIFLDPYGINLDWETVENIGKSGVFDVLINFSVMGIIRQCGKFLPPQDVQERINILMGDNKWISTLYKESPQYMLIPTDNKYDRQKGKIAEELVERYKKKLKTCFRAVSRSIIMRNSTGGPIYALILASQSPTAVTKMNEVFKSIENKKARK